jgi:hypothetical protein
MTRAGPGVPERVGRYEVLLPIASGGMATVYLARARGAHGFENEVALKLTHAHLRESPELAAELLDEAKLTVRIRHRNVVSVLDAGDDPCGIFLVMEYVEGDTLEGLRKPSAGGPPPAPIAARILLDALAGLHAAHELRDEGGRPLGLVHRDFTPHNILVGRDGVARLSDFGIAKAGTRAGHTRVGNVKGKAGYMAPEQATGAPLDRRCDVWAAGVIAWEAFAGRRLHAGDDDFATMLKVVTERPPRLGEVNAAVPPEIGDVVASALEMEVADRCPTAACFAKALAAACREHGGVAETDEVAEWVARAVGQKLAARRAHVLGARPVPGTETQQAPTVRAGRASGATPTELLTSVTPPRRADPLARRVLGVAAIVVTLVSGVLLSTWRAAATTGDDTSGRMPAPAASTSIATAVDERAVELGPIANAPLAASARAAPVARPRAAATTASPSRPSSVSSVRAPRSTTWPGQLSPNPY